MKTSKIIMLVLLTLVTVQLVSCKTADKKVKCEQSNSKAFEMNERLGRGINLGNALEAPNEGEWGVTIHEEYFDIIKKAGFNSVRLPVRWSGHAMTEKPYTIEPRFFKRVDAVVNGALERDLAVILNVQQYVELYADPIPQKERFVAIWNQIAEHYKGKPEILMLELFNEPDDAFTPEIWNDFVKATIPVIRQSNPDRIIIVDSANDAWPSYLKYLELPESDRNIIVSIHYYFPLAFTHQGAPWMAKKYDPNSWMGTTWTGTRAEKKEITDAFNIAAKWGKKHNRPINLGEFGSYKKADMESRARWAKFIAGTASERGMSLLAWDFCAEFGLYDRYKKTWHKEMLDAVILPK